MEPQTFIESPLGIFSFAKFFKTQSRYTIYLGHIANIVGKTFKTELSFAQMMTPASCSNGHGSSYWPPVLSSMRIDWDNAKSKCIHLNALHENISLIDKGILAVLEIV